MAAAVMMTLPVMLLFFFSQRYFIEGSAMSGIKR
jgi:ABC-type maltose transport system permease subunit